VKAQSLADYKRRILRVLVHIQAHLDEPLPLDELAGVAAFSPYHFHRIFRGMVGESVKEHVRRLRLERAAHRLRFTGQPVTEIAFDAGYETHESFTRAFGAMFGESPSKYRLSRRPAAYGPAASGIHFTAEGAPDDFRPAAQAGPPLAVRIESLPQQRVAFRRHQGPYDGVGITWARLMAWAGRRGVLGPYSAFFGVVHDDPEVTPPEKLRYDAAVVVPASVAEDADIGIQEIPAGGYAVATHRGPYERLGDTYARVCGEWLPQSGRELRAAPALEFYRNMPQTTPPEDLITDIYLPLNP
jgi:AraC family transcriptional regulator